MENEEKLYNYFREYDELRELKASIENEEKVNVYTEKINKINEKIDRFSSLMNSMIEYQEKINNKGAGTLLKIQEKSALTSANDYLHLSHTHHNDFHSLLTGKEKLEKHVNERVLHEAESRDEIRDIIQKLQNIKTSSLNKVRECVNDFTASKGLLSNISQLKDLDQDEPIDDKNDSDLGCYPYDSNLNFEGVTLSDFATSSPISKSKLIDNS